MLEAGFIIGREFVPEALVGVQADLFPRSLEGLSLRPQRFGGLCRFFINPVLVLLQNVELWRPVVQKCLLMMGPLFLLGLRLVFIQVNLFALLMMIMVIVMPGVMLFLELEGVRCLVTTLGLREVIIL